MQMLGLIDYDLDLDAKNYPGFVHSMEEAARNATRYGEDIQRGAVVALLNADLQMFARAIQTQWVKTGAGSCTIGPEDVSVEDWITANAIDCAGIMGLGYQDASRYNINKTGIFVSNLLANMHDSLYDIGCSSRMSNVLYARGAGVPASEMHRAIAAVGVACLDDMARRIRDASDYDVPLYGDCMGIIGASWSAFNGRYRTWERFVKYSRQLRQSKSTEAKAILDTAANQRSVLAGDETKLGVDHPSTLTSMANLASTYRNEDRWDDAEKLLIQIIETRKTKLGVDHLDTLSSIGNLALTYSDQER